MTVASPRHRELGLTDREYELIVEHMEREPNEVELAVFSLMWSEHCAYKHSKRLLRSLPVEGGRVVMGPGENAGVVAFVNASEGETDAVFVACVTHGADAESDEVVETVERVRKKFGG